MLQTARLESMSPKGSLRLMRQDDGDVILVVEESDSQGNIVEVASVEFCTPFGGGGSPATWAALVQLMGAMATDNIELGSGGRRPDYINENDQRRLVEWAKQCRIAQLESDEFSRQRDEGDADGE